MKKLIIYNHLGEVEEKFDVYVDGQSFAWRSPVPKVVWLGSVVLKDVEEVVEVEEIKEPEPEPEPEPVEEVEVTEPEVPFTTLPITIEEAKEEEVKVEPEKIDDKGTGDTRTDKAGLPEDIEKLHKKSARRQVSKRGKRHRQPKSA